MTTDEQIKLADRIMATAETARQVAGNNYSTRVKPWRKVVENWAKKAGIQPLEVVPAAVAAGTMSDSAIMWLTAAAYDLTIETVEKGRARK